jgi:hypothetical protein
VRQCGSLRQCAVVRQCVAVRSARISVRQCTQQWTAVRAEVCGCPGVWHYAALCSTMRRCEQCGSATVRTAVCGSASGSSVRQCALQCVAVRGAVCGCPAVRECAAVNQCAAVRHCKRQRVAACGLNGTPFFVTCTSIPTLNCSALYKAHAPVKLAATHLHLHPLIWVMPLTCCS